MTPVITAARYKFLYRILTMPIKSQLNITIPELKDTGFYHSGDELFNTAVDVKTCLSTQMDAYRIRVFKKHIRITRP